MTAAKRPAVPFVSANIMTFGAFVLFSLVPPTHDGLGYRCLPTSKWAKGVIDGVRLLLAVRGWSSFRQ